ncbi:MAG: sensor histidine kinase, partial [Bacteroidota bacterium]
AGLGIFYHRVGKLPLAKKYLLEELRAIETCDNERHLNDVLFYLGQIDEAEGKRQESRRKYEKSYQLSADSEYSLSLRDVSEALYLWHKKHGSPNKALTYLEVYQKVRDDIFNQENTRKLAWLEADYRMQQVTDSLNYQKTEETRLLNAEIADKKRQQNSILLGALASVFLLIIFYFYNKKQRQLTYQKDLADEKAKGFNAVILATEEERKRIAKDLHDGIVQQLGGLKLGLQKVFADNRTEESNNILKVLDNSTKELRELSHQMMPRALSELGLLPAMEDMLSNSLGHTDIKYSLEHFGIQKSERFPENIEISLYRIAQELINNVIKHSEADFVSIQLMKTGNTLISIVEDNGKGIKSGIGKKGIGLMNITSRVDTVNGDVNYEPSPGGGTLTTIKIPL